MAPHLLIVFLHHYIHSFIPWTECSQFKLKFKSVNHCSFRWGAAVDPASYQKLFLPRTRPLRPAPGVMSAWNTSTSPAFRHRATSGVCVRHRTHRRLYTPSVSPTVVTSTAAVLASRSSSKKRKCHRWGALEESEPPDWEPDTPSVFIWSKICHSGETYSCWC